MTDMNSTPPSGVPTPLPTGNYHSQYAAPVAPPAASQSPQQGQPYYFQQPPRPQPQHQQPQHQQPQTAATATNEKKSHGLRTFLVAFAGALLACALFAGAVGIYNGVTGSNSKSDSSNSGSQIIIGSQGSTSSSGNEDQNLTLAESVAQKSLPSVAAIDVYVSQSTSMYGYGYGNSNSDSSTLTQSSLGSGVVLTEDGYIVTNYHVIEGGEAFNVTIEGETYEAEVVGSDPSSDIAVIKAKNASGLSPVEIGDSDSLIIGEWVMTIGSPFGLEQSVATGIVSATSRSQIMNNSTDGYGYSSGETTIYPNMIQTDAAINPGNSGGALVDADGKLIGINTLITSYSGNYSGVGFAIPGNYAINIAQQIIDGKTPTHAQLGVSLSTVTKQVAQRYGLSVDAGAYISVVNEGSGAAGAGLKVGDIVTAFDGQTVESASDLMLDVRSKNPGDAVTLTINRDGQTSEVQVTLGSDASTAKENASTQQQESSSLFEHLFGGSGSSQDKAA